MSVHVSHRKSHNILLFSTSDMFVSQDNNLQSSLNDKRYFPLQLLPQLRSHLRQFVYSGLKYYACRAVVQDTKWCEKQHKL